MKCVNCGHENPAGLKFCGQCGIRLGLLCSECGFNNPLDNNFCGKCGARLSRIPGAAPPSRIESQDAIDVSAGQGTAPAHLVGERRVATVMLADVKDSTGLLEQVGTESWVEIMNRIFQILETEIYHYGGKVDQFRGDGLVAFFGATSAHEDDPERAVLTALAMQASINRYAVELAKNENIQLQLRVGVSTGDLIVAQIGDRRQYSEDTAMGEAVAQAARMESAAEPGTVLVSEHTYRLVKTKFDWEPLGEIGVKGMSQPVAVYRPLAPSEEIDRRRNQHQYGLSTPLIGRDDEFESLKSCIEDVREGKGGIAMVNGEAGIGKPRLVAEVRQQDLRDEALLAGNGNSDHTLETAPQAALTWMEGYCRSYGQSVPYSIWLVLLRKWFGIHEGEKDANALDRLRIKSEALWGDQLDEYYPYLASLLSLPLEKEYTQRVEGLGAEGLQQQFFLTVRCWVEEIARKGPLVIFIEDMHWADATSLQLLEYCLPVCDHESLLWLTAFRMERNSPTWEFHHRIETDFPHRLTNLQLLSLPEQESKEMVDHLVDPDAVPTETVALILEKADGNPYYIEQLIYSLIGQGVLAQDSQSKKWHVTREVTSLDLPDTLQSLLLAQIDNLSQDERHVLQMAAVIGSVFWSKALGSMVNDSAALKDHLNGLQRAQIIVEGELVPELGRRYTFKSTMIRAAAYESILNAQRSTYHRQVADFLEELISEEALAQYHSMLAYHYHHAGESRKELFHILLAAEQTQGIYANTEALEHFTRALELINEIEQVDSSELEEGNAEILGEVLKEWRLEALSGLGEVCFGIGNIPEAEKYFQQAIALGKEIGQDPRGLVRLYYWLGEVFFWQNRSDERIHIGEEGLALLGDNTKSVEAALMNQTIAAGYVFKGRTDKFREYCYQTAGFIKELPYSEELRPAYVHIIVAYLGEKKIKEALDWLQVLKQKGEQYHDLRALGEVYHYTAEILDKRGDLHGAIDGYQKAMEVFTRIGDAKHENRSLKSILQAFVSLGQIQEAGENISLWLQVAEAVGDKALLADGYWTRGLIFICQGAWEKAVDSFQKAGPLYSEVFSYQDVWTLYAIGRVFLAQGNQPEALKQFEKIGPAGFMVVKADPFVFGDGLSGIEEAYEDSEEYRSFCNRFRKEYPDVSDSPFTQWYLEPADVRTNGELLYNDDFKKSLSSGWVWLDPFEDCSFAVRNGLEMHAANGRNLWRINLSAPRMLRKVSGDFTAQVVCVRVSAEMPSIGGILLWKDEENWLRLDRGTRGEDEISFSGCLENTDLMFGRGQISSGRVFLRLERLGHHVKSLCSPDGKAWFTVGEADFPENDPIEIGLHAIGHIDRLIYPGAYPDGTAIRFISFHLWEI